MRSAEGSTFEAKVARYNIARIRLFQVLMPLALGTGALARHNPTLLTGVLAFGAQAVCLGVFLSALRRFGWQVLRFERGGISVGATGVRIERIRVSRWTLAGRAARIYERDQSFKIVAGEGVEQELEALLERQFGAPTRLFPRGSFRARMIALGVATSGLVLAPLAIVNDVMWLFTVGLLAFLLGVPTFLALSQRVA